MLRFERLSPNGKNPVFWASWRSVLTVDLGSHFHDEPHCFISVAPDGFWCVRGSAEEVLERIELERRREFPR